MKDIRVYRWITPANKWASETIIAMSPTQFGAADIRSTEKNKFELLKKCSSLKEAFDFFKKSKEFKGYRDTDMEDTEIVGWKIHAAWEYSGGFYGG